MSIGLFYARTGLRNTSPCESDDNMIHYINDYAKLTISTSLWVNFSVHMQYRYYYTVPPVNHDIYFLTCLFGNPPPPLRQGQRCYRISLYVSIFVGVTLLPWYINHVFRLITLLLSIFICKFVRKTLALLNVLSFLLIRSGNVKTNPGPYKN